MQSEHLLRPGIHGVAGAGLPAGHTTLLRASAAIPGFPPHLDQLLQARAGGATNVPCREARLTVTAKGSWILGFQGARHDPEALDLSLQLSSLQARPTWVPSAGPPRARIAPSFRPRDRHSPGLWPQESTSAGRSMSAGNGLPCPRCPRLLDAAGPHNTAGCSQAPSSPAGLHCARHRWRITPGERQRQRDG